MTQISWTFKYGAGAGTDFTTSVQSWSAFSGRRNYLDQYAGGRIAITIKNQTNLAANLTRGTIVWVEGPNAFGLYGKVNTIEFNDYPGNTGLSTATIVVEDALAQAGRVNLGEFAGYTTGLSTAQAVATNGYGYKVDVTANGTGSATVSGVTSYTGTMLNRLNLLTNSERGQMGAPLNGVWFSSRDSLLQTPTYTLTRNTQSTNQITYSDFRRIQAGDNFLNYAQVFEETSPGNIYGGANNDSITLWGRVGYSTNTLLTTASAGLSLAAWLANTQSDPTTLRYEVDFSTSNNANPAPLEALTYAVQTNASAVNLVYRVPGAGADTTVLAIMEGIQISATPAETRFTVYLSPQDYYQYFKLDSATFGILDTSRLGW